MKYTPEELLQFIKDNYFTLDLDLAMNNNEIGFEYSYFKVTLQRGEDGYYFKPEGIFEKVFEETPERFKVPDDTNELLLRKALKKPEDHIAAYLYRDRSEGDGLNVTISFFENDDEYEAIIDSVRIAFIKATEADTHGKLRAVLRKGYEAYKQEEGVTDDFEFFRDAFTSVLPLEDFIEFEKAFPRKGLINAEQDGE